MPTKTTTSGEQTNSKTDTKSFYLITSTGKRSTLTNIFNLKTKSISSFGFFYYIYFFEKELLKK
jgi:hypothetical protein